MNVLPTPREPRSRKERIAFISIAIGLAIVAVALGVSGQWWLAGLAALGAIAYVPARKREDGH
jgi:4-hydroxybenzoate polyprenyltransferase